MFKRGVSIVLAVALAPYVTSCTSVQTVNLADVERPELEQIVGVVTVTGERVDFDEPSTDIRNDTIYATVDASPYAIGMDQVEQLQLYRTDSKATVTNIGIFAVLIGIVVVAAVMSALAGGS